MWGSLGSIKVSVVEVNTVIKKQRSKISKMSGVFKMRDCVKKVMEPFICWNGQLSLV